MIENVVIDRDLGELTLVYAQVFAGPPWNEHTRCPIEDKFFGRDTLPGNKCPACQDAVLEEAYPQDTTSKKIMKEITRPKAVALVKRDAEGRIVAFSWGYSYQNPSEFAQDKYPASMHETIEVVLSANGIDGELFYLSETGIVEEFRGNGLTNEFYLMRLHLAQSLGLPVVVRTNCESPIVAVANRYGFKQVMGPKSYVDKERKKIVVSDELAGCKDAHNPERVLFVLANRN